MNEDLTPASVLAEYLEELDPAWTVEYAIRNNVVRPKPPLGRPATFERRAKNAPGRRLRPLRRKRRGHGRPRGR